LDGRVDGDDDVSSLGKCVGIGDGVELRLFDETVEGEIDGDFDGRVDGTDDGSSLGKCDESCDDIELRVLDVTVGGEVIG